MAIYIIQIYIFLKSPQRKQGMVFIKQNYETRTGRCWKESTENQE
jgi:hypothetical protein